MMIDFPLFKSKLGLVTGKQWVVGLFCCDVVAMGWLLINIKTNKQTNSSKILRQTDTALQIVGG